MGCFGDVGEVFTSVAGPALSIAGVATGNPLLTAAGMGANLISGASSANSAANAADQYASSASASADTQSRIAAESWNRYMSKFAPLENNMVTEVSKPVGQQAGTKQALAQVDRNYANMAGNLKRTMGGRYQYGSGLEKGSLLNLDINRTNAKGQAWQDSATNLFNQRLQVANIGRGLPGQAVSSSGSAANTYGNLMNTAANSAKGTWDSIGSGVGNLMQLYTLSNTPTAGSSSTSSGASSGSLFDNATDMGWYTSMVQ